MLYALEVMELIMFKWEEALLVVFKEQLTKCRCGDLKQFGYGTILVSLFLLRVHLLRPQVAFNKLKA